MKKRFSAFFAICLLLCTFPVAALPQTAGASAGAAVAVGSYMVSIPDGATPADYYTWDDTDGLTILNENVTISGMSSNVTVKEVTVKIADGRQLTIDGTVEIDVLHSAPASGDRIEINNKGTLTVAAVSMPADADTKHYEITLVGNGTTTIAGGSYHLKLTNSGKTTLTSSLTGNHGRLEISLDEEGSVVIAAGVSISSRVSISGTGTLDISAFSKSSKFPIGGELSATAIFDLANIALPAGAVAGENLMDYISAGSAKFESPATILAGNTKIGNVSGDGTIVTAPVILSSTFPVYFDSVAVGGAWSGMKYFTYANLTGPVSATITGPNADQFELSTITQENAAGWAQVFYKPTVIGNHTATLTLQSQGGAPFQVALNGTGVAATGATVSVSPASLGFGAVEVNQSKELQITITATGLTDDMQMEVYGADRNLFELDKSYLNGRTGGTLKVTYRPKQVKDASQRC
ncbi:choice-of-anchor D domain-containing protein [Eubacteriales bacterium OttesenSCG-928-N14]|nr:choice-of-anchor D domain-containing protein [Eubacteriales bacterium OttesenSCG-928-N14]